VEVDGGKLTLVVVGGTVLPRAVQPLAKPNNATANIIIKVTALPQVITTTLAPTRAQVQPKSASKPIDDMLRWER